MRGARWQENQAIRAGTRRREDEGNRRNLEEPGKGRISGEEAKRGGPRGEKTIDEEEGGEEKHVEEAEAGTPGAREEPRLMIHHHDGGGGGS